LASKKKIKTKMHLVAAFTPESAALGGLTLGAGKSPEKRSAGGSKESSEQGGAIEEEAVSKPSIFLSTSLDKKKTPFSQPQPPPPASPSTAESWASPASPAGSPAARSTLRASPLPPGSSAPGHWPSRRSPPRRRRPAGRRRRCCSRPCRPRPTPSPAPSPPGRLSGSALPSAGAAPRGTVSAATRASRRGRRPSPAS